MVVLLLVLLTAALLSRVPERGSLHVIKGRCPGGALISIVKPVSAIVKSPLASEMSHVAPG